MNSSKRKLLHLYGYEFYADEYKAGVPKVAEHLYEKFKQGGVNLNFPIATTDSGKYWSCRNDQPTSKSSFIDKFFKKNKPKRLEGIYENKMIGIIGLVWDKTHYQMYNIDIWFKDKAPKGFFDKFLYGSHDIDYSITSGTKVGALIPTSDNYIFRFDGISSMILSSEEDDVSPCNLLVELDTSITKEGNLYLEMFPPSPGFEYKRIWPSVVNNENHQEETSKNNSGLASGTGFFVDYSGHLVTNYHVVEPCNNKTKVSYKNKDYKAKLIAKDKNLDLALLKINVKNSYCIKTYDKPIKKLQSIVAAGFPLGNFLSDDLKYTSGIISSLKGTNDDTTQIQIDAALNPGNSGGPIVDKKNGELVAVAVSVAARRDVLEGINFGIKVSQVKDFLYANGIDNENQKNKNKSKNVSTVLENSTIQILCD